MGNHAMGFYSVAHGKSAFMRFFSKRLSSRNGLHNAAGKIYSIYSSSGNNGMIKAQSVCHDTPNPHGQWQK